MRILVISDLPHFVVGGAEFQAARLIEAWLDRGHEVICLGRRMRGDAVEIGRHRLRVGRIHVVQGLGRPGRALSYFLSLALLLLRHRRWPDVIYTRFLHEAAATAALLKQAGLLRCALVPTPANSGVNGDDKVIKALPFRHQLVRVLDAQCDAINLIAPAMADDLRQLGFSGRGFSFIPNGIDLPDRVPRKAQARLRLLFVGRLAPQKGLDILLSALARMAPALREKFELYLVGDGPERERLTDLAARHGLADSIHFTGEVQQDRVQDLLLQSDIFVLPSRYEGMSNAALEAMAAGLPVLLTRCGGLDTYLNESSGWVVPPVDEMALAEALARAVATPREQLSRMGQGARRIVEGNFAMAGIADRYLALFESLRVR